MNGLFLLIFKGSRIWVSIHSCVWSYSQGKLEAKIVPIFWNLDPRFQPAVFGINMNFSGHLLQIFSFWLLLSSWEVLAVCPHLGISAGLLSLLFLSHWVTILSPPFLTSTTAVYITWLETGLCIFTSDVYHVVASLTVLCWLKMILRCGTSKR